MSQPAGKIGSVAGSRVLLVGAGHVHLHLLAEAAVFARRGHQLTVIAPEDFWYSGASTGVLGGAYACGDERIDIAALIAGSGAIHVRSPLVALDPAARVAVTARGDRIAFDVASLNLGSLNPPLPGSRHDVIDVKPVVNLHRLRATIEAMSRGESPSVLRIAVVGGGMTGVEVAANVANLARRLGAPVAVSLQAANELLPGLPRPVADSVGRLLGRAGVVVHTASRVVGFEAGSVALADGRSAPADIVVNASGLAPAPLLGSIGLPLERGALIVDEMLASPAAAHIFGGGDCIALAGYRLPRIGVHAIRQAPVLLHNMLARIESRPLQPFVPQSHCLTIMNLGDGTGLALRNGMSWRGRLAWWLKDAIDRRFLDTYRRAATANPRPVLDPDTSRSQP